MHMFIELINNSTKNLIVISGISGSGKTTLGQKLSKKLGYTLLSLEDYKEKAYEAYGFKDEYERLILHDMAKCEFEASIIKEMRSEKGVIVEYPFNTSWQQFFDKVTKDYNYKLIIINCSTRDLWQSRTERDSNESVRPKCLTASAYIKDELYINNNKLNSDYKLKQEKEYNDKKYTSLTGGIVLTDRELIEQI